MHNFIIFLILALLPFGVFAQVEPEADTGKNKFTAEEIECGLSKDNPEGIEHFVEILKSGEPLDPKLLVENEYFLSPCFQQKAGQYTSSFVKLTSLATAIDELKNQEYNLVSRTNNINDKLGAERKTPAKKAQQPTKSKAKKKSYAPQYSSSFLAFKSKAKILSIKKFDGAYFANIEISGIPISDIKEGDLIRGVKIVSIDFSSIEYMDLNASKRTGRLSLTSN